MQITKSRNPMNKKTLALLVGLLTASALTLQAQTPAPAAPVAPAPTPDTFTVTPSYVTNYMFRGQRLGGSSFEPTIEYDSGNLGVGVWMNIPIADKVPGQSDPEIDPYGYYTFTLNDQMSVVPGFTLYTYPRAEGSKGFYTYTFEPNIAFNYTMGIVKLTPKLYYDVILKGPTAEITAAAAVPLKDISSELDLTAQYGAYFLDNAAKDTNPDVKAYGNYYLFGVSMPFQIGKTKVTLGYAYTNGGDAFFKQSGSPRVPNTSAAGKSVGSVSLSWTF
jgi:uncharacterized protein (TIGR02001 family)